MEPAVVIHFYGVLQRMHCGQLTTAEILYDLECDGILSTGLRAARQRNEFAIDTAFDIPAATIRPVIETYYDRTMSTNLNVSRYRGSVGTSYVEYAASVSIATGARPH